MPEETLPLMTFYGGWSTYQRMLRDMLAPLTRRQLGLSVSSSEWTIGAVAQHVIANRVWWFHMWMGEGSDELAPIADWDPAAPGETPALDASELVAGLDSSWRMIEDALNRWTADDLPQVFSPPAAMSEEERKMFGDMSRQWMIWHVMEHEIHHGGEISLTLGNHGLNGIYGDF